MISISKFKETEALKRDDAVSSSALSNLESENVSRFNSDLATPVPTRNHTSKYYDKAQRDHHLADSVFVSKK